ncbi:transglutaminase-like enzyme, cysteine protease [Halorubrum coriense DSM 10284]|uniref:Transglutaminase-like enzyme, cysteine protease n=1 Tax=Halorubrum coriense DSM 10284 TaxID=1227466 RepID=M0EQE8_9EURY|nr:transglutaminase domain-containing protein [Halorubrum coriense]ELZ49122.1 transglutaminase-like enzyme, cysteine protease [Halorubrum coriense DSM 10284]
MSRGAPGGAPGSRTESPGGDRRLADPAAVGVAVVAAAYLAVFFEVTNVVGGTARTAAVVAVAGLGGLALARVIGEWAALIFSGGIFVAALSAYLFAVPESQRALFTVRSVALDVLALSTGLSVLRLALADVWVLAVAPVPTFLVGYFAGRGRHVAAAAVAGGTLGFLVLTGDAGTGAAVAGVVGLALAVGLSTLSTPSRLRGHAGTFALIVAAMVVASATVTVIPGGAAAPLGLDRGTSTLESSLSGGDELEVVGSTRLSPEVRYTIESPVERNWHTGAYDTYTGDGWVRTGERSAVNGTLAGPPGASERVTTTITAETESGALPAPWKPVGASGGGTVEVDERGSLRLADPLDAGDEVTVESRVLDADPATLRNASTDYPAAIEERYTQLPESTPERVGDRTEEIVAAAGAESPYERAAAVEAYLRSEYAYSLTVERPEGDVADAFLFEMDAGYCVYFATTMAAMLRSQGIPTRFESGYTSGQRVGEDEYVVRGQNAHTWVSIYVPDHGWVAFDPTPSDPRDEARDTRLAEARADGAEDVDTEASTPNQTLEAEPSTGGPNAADGSGPNASENDTSGPVAGGANATNGSQGPTPGDISRLEGGTVDSVSPSDRPSAGGDGGGSIPLPDGETALYWLLVAALGVAGARRTGFGSRVGRRVGPVLPRLRRDPATDARRAFADLERLLAGRYRERRPGETPRSYVDAIRTLGADERVETVAAAYERAAYAGSVTRAEADEARRAVRRLALERLPLVGRFVR